ncbi:MAG: TonB-dependent receptor [Geobacteraceae bacterium]|nr:TonB-dependent receptor [Geobacteraceae bacterium]
MMKYFLLARLIRSFLTVSTRFRFVPRRLPALISRAFFLLAFLLVSVSHAENGGRQENAEPDLTTLTIEELMEIEVDTVSGASRYEQPVSEAPASVSIVTADEIKKYGYRNLADILQSLRGFSVINDRNYQYAGIRGFGLPGDYGARTLLLVDGVRQNESVSQATSIGTEFVVDTDLIERVEVIRGPSHSLYGANAMLAVINVITKRGRDLAGMELSGETGSFDSYKGRLSYGGKFGVGPEVLLSGTLFTSSGQDFNFPEFTSPATNFGWARNCDRDRSGNAFLKILYHDLTLEGGYVKRDKALPTAPWGTFFGVPGTETTDSSVFIDLKYHHTFENGLDMMSRFSWNEYDYDGRYVYDWTDPGDAPLLITNIDRVRNSWLQGELQVSGELSESHRLIGGIELRDVLRMVQQNYDVEMYLDDRRSSWNVGVYLQDEYQVFDSLILNAGLRYDHFDTFGDTLNPRIALIYRPVDSTSLKFLFGTGFRAPSGTELYYGDGFTMKPNPELREEQSTSYELTLEQQIARHVRGTLTGYYTRVKDLITQVTDPVDGMLVYRNLSKVDLKGMELEFDAKWDNGINGRISYSYQDAKDLTTDKRLPNSARHLVKINLLLPLIEEKLFLGMEEQYTSRKNTLSGCRTRDFFVTNATLFSRNLLKDLELSASVYNLFNSKYFVPAGGEHQLESIEQDGRTFRVKATWRF